jgi:hypothetical protein
LAKEENDGWAIVTGVTGLIHASDWMETVVLSVLRAT